MTSAIESAKNSAITGLQIRTVLFCLVLNMIDGADVLLVAYAAPLFSDQWGVTPQALGLIFSAGLAGMTLGAVLVAPFSDVFGRKTMILFATLLIAGGMALSSLSKNVEALMGYRLLVGLGIGSMLASVTALSSEYAPVRFRSLAVTVAVSGYPLGAIVAGFVSVAVLPAVGWQGLFLYASVVSLIMFPLCLAFMPESMDFLLARQPRNALARTNRIRAATGLELMASLPSPSDHRQKVPGVNQLMAPEFRSKSLLLWGAFFAAFMTLYFLTSWIPKIAVDAGLSIDNAIYAGTAFNLGAFIGLWVIGWVSSAGVKLTSIIAGFFVTSTFGMVLFGAFHTPILVFFLEIFFIGFLIQGGFGGMYAVAARQYPTVIRTTGVGWALGAGRLGAVFGPYLGGLTIGWGVSFLGNFMIFAAPMAVAAVFIALVGRKPESS